MHQDSFDARNLGGLKDTKDGVAQKRLPYLPMLKGLINGQPTQDNHRDGIGHISLHRLGGFLSVYRSVCQAVAPDYRVSGTQHIRARRDARFVLERHASEPRGE